MGRIERIEMAGQIMKKIVFSGKIFQIIEEKKGTTTFEFAKRSPGVRLLITNGEKMLLTKEFRAEVNGYDYRLPGGKVFDTMKEYEVSSEHQIKEYSLKAAMKECLEETGIVPKKIKLMETAHAGATVLWDLYYFLVEEFEQHPEGQKLENGEEITVEWKSFEEVKELCLKKGIQEDRSVAVILRFILLRERKESN